MERKFNHMRAACFNCARQYPTNCPRLEHFPLRAACFNCARQYPTNCPRLEHLPLRAACFNCARQYPTNWPRLEHFPLRAACFNCARQYPTNWPRLEHFPLRAACFNCARQYPTNWPRLEHFPPLVKGGPGGVVSEQSGTVRLKRLGGGPDTISYTVLKGGARAASFFGSLVLDSALTTPPDPPFTRGEKDA
jgi:hypothetical protein